VTVHPRCASFLLHTFSAQLLLFQKTFMQPDVFVVVNCPVVVLSVFYSTALTHKLIFLQLCTALT